jgi:integrase
MGRIFRKGYTQPVPPGAEIGERDGVPIARWRLRNGRLRTAEVVECADGRTRVRGRSKFYCLRYRDAGGRMVEVATRCRDEVAARAILTQHERRAELLKSGILAPDEAEVAAHADRPLRHHFAAYQKHLEAKGCAPRRVSMVHRRLARIAAECGFTKLNRMSPERVERWLVEQADAGLSASTRNGYREVLVSFGNWCRRTRRLSSNRFFDVPRADTNADRRHLRRAMTEAELLRLLHVARLRSLAEYGRRKVARTDRGNRPKHTRATWNRAPLTYEDLDAAVARAREALEANPDLVPELERRGRERALIYRTLALTGLRRSELASLTVGQLLLDQPVPYAVLDAADEKNRKGSDIPLRRDLAAALREWLGEKLAVLQDACREWGEPIPARLPADTRLFDMPTGFIRIFDRDLATAGIAKRDERNRVVDIHALRVTFGTHLCAAGVPLRTAQAAMRHSKPELTANIYTDPRLLDVAGALNALPALASESAATADRTASPRRRFEQTPEHAGDGPRAERDRDRGGAATLQPP